MARAPIAWLGAMTLALCACRQDMHDAARLEAYEGTTLFSDGRAMRPRVEGTLARGEIWGDEHLERGVVDGKPAQSFPFAIDRAALLRGRERFGIFCAPCHGNLGAGDGIIVQRGLKAPESFHVERLRQAPPGYFFDVMTNGFGAMIDVADRVGAADRWKIAAWIRVVQESQSVPLAGLDPSQRAALDQAEAQAALPSPASSAAPSHGEQR